MFKTNYVKFSILDKMIISSIIFHVIFNIVIVFYQQLDYLTDTSSISFIIFVILFPIMLVSPFLMKKHNNGYVKMHEKQKQAYFFISILSFLFTLTLYVKLEETIPNQYSLIYDFSFFVVLFIYVNLFLFLIKLFKGKRKIEIQE